MPNGYQCCVAIALFILPSILIAESDPQQAAMAAYARKDYAACAEMFSRLGREKGDTSSLYNGVSCYALAGNKEAAFAVLDELMRGGWSDTRLLRNDPDLGSLREDPRWISVIAQSESNWTKKFGDTNRELWAIREADEADRQSDNIDVKAAIDRDRLRLARVKEIIAAGNLKTGMDYFIAAMIHQHGSDAEDYAQARALALRAAELDPANTRARWLAAAAHDRYLHKIGKPQIYGTQFRKVDGVWTLDPIDETAINDEERAKSNVPSLAAARRRVEEMNRKK